MKVLGCVIEEVVDYSIILRIEKCKYVYVKAFDAIHKRVAD